MCSTMCEHELFVAGSQELLAETVKGLDELVFCYRFTERLE